MAKVKINMHAGHNPSNKIACGASGFLDESNQARKIVKYAIKILKKKKYIVYNCTCNNGKSQLDVLQKIVAKCNLHRVTLDISVHLNSGKDDQKNDEHYGGVEVWVTTGTLKNSIKYQAAKNICKEIEKLGFYNRGIKFTKKFYVLNNTNAQAILIECCFVDNKDDYELYKKGNYPAMAKAIATGIEKALR